MRKLIAIISVALVVNACASYDTELSTLHDNAQYIDLTDVSKKDLVDNYWQVEFRKEPKYPVSAAKKGLSGCSELAFGINSEGKLSQVKVIKSYPEGVFDSSAAKALTYWRWTPTATNKNLQPVLTTIQLDFMLVGAKNSVEATAKCNSTKSIAAVTSN